MGRISVFQQGKLQMPLPVVLISRYTVFIGSALYENLESLQMRVL